jgi:GT2 family glycosyltransferase
MKIAVVVLHYRNLSDTLECLDSLQRQDDFHFEILLVNNDLADTAWDNVTSRYARLHFIQNAKNLGFAEGSNVGIRAALERGADAVLLLNNDTTASPDLLSAFASAAAAHPNAGALGAKILYYEDPTVIWHAGGDVHPISMRCFHEGCTDSDLEKKWDTVRPINYACGCALFVTKAAIEKVGLLAPEFFLIWEEIDWCWRIRKAGYECLYIPQARVWHKISRAFEGGNRGPLWQYYYFRNRLLFLKRNIPLLKRLRFYWTHFPKELAQILWTLINPHSSKDTKCLSRFALKGICDYMINKFFTYPSN